MRILIPVPDQGTGWLGGGNYFRSLLQALNAHPDPSGAEVLAISNSPAMLADCQGASVAVREAAWLSPWARTDYLCNDVCNSLLNRNPYLDREARRLEVDLITHAAAGRGAPCPVLNWIPDFQHRHLPGFFSAYERWRRDRNVRAATRQGHLLVSSESAAADFRLFFPQEATQTSLHVLPFVPLLPTIQADETPAEVQRRRGIDGPYFFLPNQFWRHKNHRVAVRALQLLPDQFRIVSTGAIADRRSDEHIHNLLNEIDEGKLGERFRMLGVVPRSDLLPLMRGALCVINPSLFEGWSTVVEEAKYLGKAMILSDIPVHREQAGGEARYFDPHDPDALAAAMQAVIDAADMSEEADRARRMQARLAEAIPTFASRYWQICHSVLDSGTAR